MKVLSVLFSIVLLGVTAKDVPQMPGGYHPIPVKDVLKFMPLIENYYNAHSRSDDYAVVAGIVSAQAQVVAGQNFKIKFELHTTTCKKPKRSHEECITKKVSSLFR